MKKRFGPGRIDIEDLFGTARHKVKGFKKEAQKAISEFNNYHRGEACSKLLLNTLKSRDISNELTVRCVEFCKSVLVPQYGSHKISDKKYPKIRSKFIKRIGDAEHLPVIEAIISFLDGYHVEKQELFVSALESYIRVARDFPNEYIWQIIGDLYIKNENIEKAIASYEQALKYNPKAVNNCLCLGDYYLIGKKDEEKALEQYGKARKECREDAGSDKRDLAGLGEHFSALACGSPCEGGQPSESQIANRTSVEEFYRQKYPELFIDKPAYITVSPENKEDVMKWAIDCFKRSQLHVEFQMRSIILCYFELEDYKNVVKVCREALDEWNEWLCPNNEWCYDEVETHIGLFEEFAYWKGYAEAKLGLKAESDIIRDIPALLKHYHNNLRTDLCEDGNRTRLAVYKSKEETNKLLQDMLKDLRAELVEKTDILRAQIKDLGSEIENERDLHRQAEELLSNGKATELLEAENFLRTKCLASIWEKLTDDCKRFLKTAEFVYQVSKNTTDKDSNATDWACVIVELSKAVEEQLKATLIPQLQDYMSENGIKKICKDKFAIDKLQECTLPQICVILGDGILQEYPPFKIFLSENFPKLLNESGMLLLKEIQKFAEKYRNPACHKDSIDKNKAEAARQMVLISKDKTALMHRLAECGISLSG